MEIKNNIQKYTPFLIVIVFFILCYQLLTALNFDNVKYINISGENIKVELALTKEEKIQGLSGREGLEENEGMLFIFDNPDKHYFWMKGMNFPIDIIWIAEDNHVIYIKKDAPVENFLNTYGPEEDSKYVLEVISGFSEKHNLQIGDKVEFLYR